MNYLLLAIAVLPPLAICWFIFLLDRHNPEPFEVLFRSFLLGVAACVPAYLLERMGATLNLDIPDNLWKTAIFAFIIVALSEEVCKFLFLRFYAYEHPAFDEPLDGIVYSVMVSMGFAAFENIVYGLTTDTFTLVVRMFTAVPAHAAFGIVMGYHIGKAKFERDDTDRIGVGLTAAWLLHGLYDFFLFQQVVPGLQLFAIVFLFVSLYYAWQLLSELRRDSKKRWSA